MTQFFRKASQRELDFAEAERLRQFKETAEQEAEDLDELLTLAVGRIGHKSMAERLGIGLERVRCIYAWLERKDDRRPPAELLLAAVKEDKTDEAMRAFCELAGFETPRRKVLLPPEEALEQLSKEAVRRFGDAGETMVREVLSRPAPRQPQEWEKPLRSAT